MSIFNFELSLKSKISEDDIFSSLANYFNLSVKNITNQNEYFDLSNDEQKSALGVSISYGDIGYRTFLNGISYFEIYNEKLSDLAQWLSSLFMTEVVIGDYIHDVEIVTGRFIVYFPDGNVKFAIEKVNDFNFDINFL